MLFRTGILILLLAACTAKAEMNCTSDETEYSINIHNVYVPANSLPGVILAVEPHTVHITCKGSGNYQQIANVSNSSWSSSGLTANVDGLSCRVIDQGSAISELGLGMVITNYNSATGTWACVTAIFSGSGGVSSLRRGLIADAVTTLTDKFYVVRTNKDLAYGESGELNQTIYVDEADINRDSRGSLYLINFNGTIDVAAGGCSVASRIDVSMGTVSLASFQGIGTTGSVVPFNMYLTECFGAAKNALINLEPTYGFVDASKGVIALSSEAGMAGGIGIQVMLNGKEIDSGEPENMTLVPGTTTVPFTARYYQYLDTVQAGNADSTLIFNIYYE